jgi:hypothetical protein
VANPIGVRLVGPVAGLFMLASVVLFRFYTLPDQIEPAGEDPEPVAPGPPPLGALALADEAPG